MRAEYLGSKKKGDENLSMPMSRTLCLVAFSVKSVILEKMSPRFTIRLFALG